eukprot:9496306-Pyramimonas_sp.AAC.1
MRRKMWRGGKDDEGEGCKEEKDKDEVNKDECVIVVAWLWSLLSSSSLSSLSSSSSSSSSLSSSVLLLRMEVPRDATQKKTGCLVNVLLHLCSALHVGDQCKMGPTPLTLLDLSLALVLGDPIAGRSPAALPARDAGGESARYERRPHSFSSWQNLSNQAPCTRKLLQRHLGPHCGRVLDCKCKVDVGCASSGRLAWACMLGPIMPVFLLHCVGSNQCFPLPPPLPSEGPSQPEIDVSQVLCVMCTSHILKCGGADGPSLGRALAAQGCAQTLSRTRAPEMISRRRVVSTNLATLEVGLLWMPETPRQRSRTRPLILGTRMPGIRCPQQPTLTTSLQNGCL